MRSARPGLRRLLPLALVLAAASCGAHAPDTSGPAASASPGATATPARSASPRTTATRPPAATAVISGVVRARPACPADPVYHACRPRPLGGVDVQARSPAAHVMAAAKTLADGHYVLRLQPGRYLLVVMTTQTPLSCPQVPVSVRTGELIRADLNCGTTGSYPAIVPQS